MTAPRLFPVLALAALAMGLPACNETPEGGIPGTDDDDAVADDDDAVADDDDAGSGCWQADTMLDVSGAAGAGDGYPAPELSAECVDGELVVAGNGIPTYEFVAITPNPLVAVAQTYRISLAPEIAARPTDIPLLGVAGFAVNGLPWFGPNEAERPDPFGDPIHNGIVDGCSGHTAPQGYHQHALVQKCLTQEAVSSSTPWTMSDPDDATASPVIGWALDGFPIYGPVGCLDTDCNEVAVMNSSWNQTGDPTTYAWDNHEFVERNDPTYLDRCNGREQPDGTYGYHATATFPYILGCYVGTAEGTGGGGPGDDDDDAPGGPTECEDSAECEGECPEGSLGCTCTERPNGQGGICVPTCTMDSDCEALVGGPPGGLTCDEGRGICVPAQGP